MSKKEGIVRINEDLMRGIMTGDIPASRLDEALLDEPQLDEPSQKSEEPLSEQKEVPAAESAAAKPAARRKRKEEPEGYESKFLVNQSSKYRITVNISRELFDRIRSFLPMIAPDVTMTSYLNNIVSEHIETHLDEINKLYNSKIKKHL